jgi:hypothetical protein
MPNSTAMSKTKKTQIFFDFLPPLILPGLELLVLLKGTRIGFAVLLVGLIFQWGSDLPDFPVISNWSFPCRANPAPPVIILAV